MAEDWEGIAVWSWRQKHRRARLLYIVAVMAAREIAARAEIFGGEDEWFFGWEDICRAWRAS